MFALALAGCVDTIEPGIVRLNEIAPANKTGCPDVFGEVGDWIELYNTSNALVDLGGYHLHDQTTPADTVALAGGVTIPPRGFLLIWADAKDDGLDHVPFKLDASNDTVTLAAPDGTPIDRLHWESGDDDHSFARTPDGQGDFEVCATPTCGTSNGARCAGP